MSDLKSVYPAIHATRRKVAGLDDEAAWRAFLERATGKRSLRQMDGAELGRVLDRLNAGAGNRAPLVTGRPVAAKARALWLSLYNLGLVASPSERALGAFVKRQTGIAEAAWLDAVAADAAIEALKAMAARAGYTPERFRSERGEQPLEGSFKPGLIAAQWQRLVDLGAFRTGANARLDTWLVRSDYGVAASSFLTDDQANAVIRDLGAWIRRLVKEQESMP